MSQAFRYKILEETTSSRYDKVRPKLWIAKVHVSMLYGRFTWFKRHANGGLTVPTKLFCQQLNIRSTHLREYLTDLADIGLIDDFQWHSSFFYCKLVPPEGMCVLTEAKTIDVILEEKEKQ